MIDLHCHLLPGIDDGSTDLEESIGMVIKAKEQGITQIVCSPHHNNYLYNNPAMKVEKQVNRLQSILDQKRIEMKLLKGQEVRISSNLIEEIDNNQILFIDSKKTYLLIEFPSSDIPSYALPLLMQVLRRGHVPILVHPERNTAFIEQPNKLLSFLEIGVLTQLTAPSIIGIFGKEIQRTAKKMITHGLGYMIASDAHGRKKRDFYLKEAYQEITKIAGIETVIEMKQMTRDIIDGNEVVRPNYTPIKKLIDFIRKN